MATGYCGVGSASGSTAISPVSESVSPERVSLSFGTTMMSPAFALFTSVASLPIMTYRCPRRSFLPVRALMSSMPGSNTPASTLKKLRRPTNGSDTVLNTNAAGRLDSSMRMESPPAIWKRPWLAGCGKYVQMSSMTPCTPCLMMVDPTNTGMNSSCAMALSRSDSNSSCVSCSSPSRYFIMSSSSASATRSQSLSRAFCATSAYSAGMSSMRSESLPSSK